MTMFASQWLANPGVTYEIDQSIRFNDGDSAYLSRTPSSGGNQRTWTFSAWVKRCALTLGGSNHQTLFSCGTENSQIRFHATGDTLNVLFGGSTDGILVTDQVFRDVAAWCHIVVAVDTTQSTASDRCKVYVNGSQVTSFSTETYPAEDYDSGFNNTEAHAIGRSAADSDRYFDGYLAEIHWIDGTAKQASDFGETASDTGQWIPKQYTGGGYGTNGFYLKGQDSSALGDDTSGNGNDYSSSGLAAADQVPDTPTPSSDSAIGNRATLMSIQDGSPTMSEGNTRFSNTGSTRIQRTTNQPLVGKTYWEVLVNNATQNTAGVSSDQISTMTNDTFYNQTTLVAGFDNANFYYNGSYSTYSQPSATQRWMFAYDADTGELWSGVNGTWHNSGNPAAGSGEIATLSTTYKWFPFIGGKSNADQQIIWGASNMSHTVPSGFTADLSTYRQPDPAIADPSAYFQSTLYTGNGSTQSINQSGNSTFQPDWVWIKNRDAADSHVLTDAVRGATKIISSDSSAAEATDADTLTAFESDGFALGDDDKVNTNTEKYVAWQWKANGSGSSNGDGDLTATVSANTTAGFSIIKYQGTGSATTVGHGLGAVGAPKMVIVKDLDNSRSWNVYHDGLSAATKVIYLDQNVTEATDSAIFGSAPTSSIVNIATANGSNGSGIDYIMYAFAEVEGYSKFGSFSGNGNADGKFVWIGFKPALVIFKNNGQAYNWQIRDNQRDPFNINQHSLSPSTSDAEAPTSDKLDFLSNGFKIRDSGATNNGSGDSIIYAAFAESPFKTANAF